MERPNRKMRKAEREHAQKGLFKLIDSYEVENIDLAIAIMSGNRSLLDAAKRRYYPIMRLIDGSLGGSWRILYQVRERLETMDADFLLEFYNIYAGNGGIEEVRALLQMHYDMQFEHIYEIGGWADMFKFPLLTLARPTSINFCMPLPDELRLDAGLLEDIELLSLDGEGTAERFWPFIAEMPNLRSLDLNGMKLKKLPLAALNTRLEILQITACGLEQIPAEIGQLGELKAFNSSQNPIKKLPDEMAELIDLETLTLYQSKLKVLPDWLPRLRGLMNLNIEGSRLRKLPRAVFEMPNLNSLLAGFNPIERLEFAENNSLVALYIENTKVKKIPPTIGLVRNLKTLSLVDTGLKKFPKSVLGCRELEYLYLSNTRIGKLPKSIVQLDKLVGFAINGTKVKRLPQGFEQLNLREITLDRKAFKKHYKNKKALLAALPPDCEIYEY